MKFKIKTTGYFYSNEEDRKRLEQIGFTFEKSDYKDFKIKGEPEIEINTLEELIQFGNNHGEIIVSDGHIEIYDDYRE